MTPSNSRCSTSTTANNYVIEYGSARLVSPHPSTPTFISRKGGGWYTFKIDKGKGDISGENRDVNPFGGVVGVLQVLQQ